MILNLHTNITKLTSHDLSFYHDFWSLHSLPEAPFHTKNHYIYASVFFRQTSNLFLCFALQIALIGFSMILLSHSLPAWITLWLRNPHQSKRKRECLLQKRRKKPKEPLLHGQVSNPLPPSTEPSALSTRPWHPALLASVSYPQVQKSFGLLVCWYLSFFGKKEHTLISVKWFWCVLIQLYPWN